MRILFLPRWYPNRYDPMPGLFIQRQAEIVAQSSEVAVIYLHEVDTIKQNFEVVVSIEKKVKVIRVYYKIDKPKVFLLKWMKILNFYKAFSKAWRNLDEFKPDLIHVHVLTRMGVLAFIKKIQKGIPFIITEHWSRYFPENGSYKGFLRKALTKLVINNASSVIAVSSKLKEAMMAEGLRNSAFFVLGNPVDMQQFSPTVNGVNKSSDKIRIIHVSCFEDKSKNLKGFLNALKSISEGVVNVECLLIGDGPDFEMIKMYAKSLCLPEGFLKFTGLLEGEALVDQMKNADFLVLSSRYETFATVIVEALACGLPVVSTDVGIAPEIINSTNGIIVPTENTLMLENAIKEMILHCKEFDRNAIHNSVEDKFNPEVIKTQLLNVYLEALKNRKTKK